MSTIHLHPPDAPYQWESMQIPQHMQAALFGGLMRSGILNGQWSVAKKREVRLRWAGDVLGYPVATFRDLDAGEAGELLEALRRKSGQTTIARARCCEVSQPLGTECAFCGEMI